MFERPSCECAGWNYSEALKYFKKSENANLSHADPGYHGHGGLLSVTDVPYRTPIAKAFVDAGSEIGLPVVDVNGEKQVGVNYLQVTRRPSTIRVNNSNFYRKNAIVERLKRYA